MDVILLDITEIKPYKNNPRNNDSAIDKVAKSIKEFGWKQPIVLDNDNIIIAGHTRYLAAKKLGIETIPVVIAKDLSPEQIKAYRLADNRVAQESSWNNELLTLELEELKALEFDLLETGFNQDEIDDLLNSPIVEGMIEDDQVPEVKEEAITVRGDIWRLGTHRLMCGDSTIISDVEKLMNWQKSRLLHADPPYGMGKEKDGVQNDNLYDEKLDKFQLEWWATFRTFIEDNASVYIWGNAPELWRLWYQAKLGTLEPTTFRNEIVWEKSICMGQSSDLNRMYPTITERCLFFILGEQGFNTNSSNYFTGWDEIVFYLNDQRKIANWSIKDTKKIAGHSENSGCHWFEKSQWLMPTEKTYNAWKNESQGQAFNKTYQELNDQYQELKKNFNQTKAYFDNTHENMSDVWRFPSVTGQERYSHSTPKPVLIMERIIKSSSEKNDIVIEPFAGTGSTLIACEKLKRKCYTMELSEQYCDVVIRRWQEFTGKSAILEGNEKSFYEISSQRLKNEK